MRKHLGNVVVDTGTILIADPCNALHERDGDDQRVIDQEIERVIKENNWRGAGEVILASSNGRGVVSATRDGDGSYPVYGYYDEEGQLTKIEIKLALF